jgi:hypothetical protein
LSGSRPGAKRSERRESVWTFTAVADAFARGELAEDYSCVVAIYRGLQFRHDLAQIA